jgi:hypothetical protein
VDSHPVPKINYRIKHFWSYFSTKTGARFALYSFIPTITESSISYTVDQSSLVNRGSNLGNHKSSGVYIQGGQCFCGQQQPQNSYDPNTGIYINENGEGFSMTQEAYNKMKKGK